MQYDLAATQVRQGFRYFGSRIAGNVTYVQKCKWVRFSLLKLLRQPSKVVHSFVVGDFFKT